MGGGFFFPFLSPKCRIGGTKKGELEFIKGRIEYVLSYSPEKISLVGDVQEVQSLASSKIQYKKMWVQEGARFTSPASASLE